MARRSSAASRSSRSSRSRGGRASAREGRGPKPRSDGRVDAPCPQCGTRYRVSEEALDVKLECQECHRVFFPKTTAGKRAQGQDYTKMYIGLGALALFIVITFAFLSSGSSNENTEKPRKPVEQPVIFTPGTHPRTAQLVKWAQSVRTQNDLVFTTHTDLRAVAALVESESEEVNAVMAAMRTHASTQYLRDLDCTSGTLLAEADMTSDPGKGTVFLVPPTGSKDYENDRAEVELTFRMDGEQVRVQSWTVTRKIRRLTPDPNRRVTVNKHIARANTVEISDSAGTRKVMESEPGPVPHLEEADAVMRAKVDEVIAGVLRSAANDGPPIARFTLKIRSLEERKAAVPRALNAMFELYGDVNGNKMKLSQLDRALRDWTGFATNFQVRDSENTARDKTERESCIRQWFAFWWRYSNSGLDEFFDMRENLDEPLDGEKGGDKTGDKTGDKKK